MINTRELPYPENLYCAIFGVEFYREIPDDGLDKALEILTEREKTLIQFRFKDGLTLVEVGDKFGVKQERIRQIESRALRRLRHPKQVQYLKYGEEAIAEFNAYQEETRKLVHEKRFALMKQLQQQREEALLDAERANIENPFGLTIGELGLSVRAFNCLARAGFKTLSCISAKTKADLLRVRNMGAKSLNEIVEKLLDYGVELDDE